MAQANLTLEHTTAQLRKLGSQMARIEEHERSRLAHILHDQLQQMLVAARFNLSAIEKGLSDGNLLNSARAAANAVDEALRESKSLVVELSPPILREGGLAPAIKWLCQRMHEKQGLSVEVRTDAQVDEIGEDLRIAIFHAVRELLFNVVKHSGARTAMLEICVQPDRQVRVVVADSGCGFTPIPAHPQSGMDQGFGQLAIRERLRSLGGRMTIDSAPGQGCRVTLLAPIPRSVLSPQAVKAEDGVTLTDAPFVDDRNSPQSPIAGSRIRVLLADDHAILRQGLAELLSRDPALQVVGEASDGEAAVQQARALRPEVVLMDVSMPRMNGIDATRVIHAEFPDIIVIGLSLYAEPHRADEMRQAGAAAYVSKTEAAEVLVATLHACCGR